MSLEIVQIIVDEPLHAQLLDRSLRQARYRTNVAGDGVTGLADVKRLKPSLVLLDLMLPGMNGLEVCRRIRDATGTRQIPIIMLSALGGEADRIAGIEMGADDYVTKPFSPREVISRVASLLRRARQPLDQGLVTDDDSVSIEEHCLRITLFGRQLTISQLEWRLLHLLTKRVRQVVPTEELESLIWTDDTFLRSRDLDAMIGTLKAKLRNALSGSIEIISTNGYRFIPPPATS